MFVLCFSLYVTFHLHVSLILGAISLIFVGCLTQIKFIALTGLCLDSQQTNIQCILDVMHHDEEYSFVAFLRLIVSVHFRCTNQHLLSPHQ